MKRAIVLSGGGAKGAYQIGVWRALRKMGLKYDIVTGTSVGALNGALMVQKEYIKARSMWYNINFDMIFDEQLDGNFNTFKGKIEIFKKYMSNFLLHGGMDVSKLEKTMEKYIDHKKFYKSNIDYALVTVNLSSFKPVLLTKDNIPTLKLKDYLMASATCFPAFKMKTIDDDLFIDGAYYDKIPINQAIKMGATEIIAVDLNSFGLTRKVKEKDVTIIYITPRNKLDSFLIFDKNFSRRSMKLGYNDAMKTFNKLDGNKYTFRKNHLNKNFNKYYSLYKENLINIINKCDDDSIIKKEVLTKNKISDILNNKEKKSLAIINELMEYLGERYKLDDSIIYRTEKYNKLLLEANSLYEEFNIKLIESKIKNKDIIKLADRGYFIKYIFNKINSIEQDEKVKREICNYLLIFEKDVLAAIYLYTISKK